MDDFTDAARLRACEIMTARLAKALSGLIGNSDAWWLGLGAGSSTEDAETNGAVIRLVQLAKATR